MFLIRKDNVAQNLVLVIQFIPHTWIWLVNDLESSEYVEMHLIYEIEIVETRLVKYMDDIYILGLDTYCSVLLGGICYRAVSRFYIVSDPPPHLGLSSTFCVSIMITMVFPLESTPIGSGTPTLMPLKLVLMP